MHLPRLISLAIYLAALASSSPIAWPDDKLEEINILRAKGISEAEIAARNPRPLTSPSPAPLPEPVSFFGPSALGTTADVSPLAPRNGQTVQSEPRRRHYFRESVGRRGEEIVKRL